MSNSSEDMDNIRMERRRLRMRLAQRKHRARQEQKVQDLENEIQSRQTKLEAFETNFNDLEIKLLEASAHDPRCAADVQRAINLFRQSSKLKPSPHYNPGIPRSFHMPVDPVISSWSDTSGYSGALPSFSLKLYDYCTRLGFRLLSSRDGVSLRLARKIFQHRLAFDSEKSEDFLFVYLRDCLHWRSRKLDNKSMAPKYCQKALDMPRWPGYSNFLDVVGVEKYLQMKGIQFADDTVQLSVDVARMPTDFSDASMNFFDTNEAPTQLPFGLVDINSTAPEGGLPSPDSLGSPRFDDDWMQFDADLTKHLNTKAANNSQVSQTSLQISSADLIERLALSAICIGGPGPGFLPEDIDQVLGKLTAQMWESME